MLGIFVAERLEDDVAIRFAQFAFDGAALPSTWWYWCDLEEAIALA